MERTIVAQQVVDVRASRGGEVRMRGIFCLTLVLSLGSGASGCGDDATTKTDAAITTPDVSSTDVSSTDVANAAPKSFGELCSSDDDCLSAACFMGGMGSFCSLRCSLTDQVDPVCTTPPSTGQCNKQGFCRKP